MSPKKNKKKQTKKTASKKAPSKRKPSRRKAAPRKKKRAGSESVEELLEEGNAFEAEVVKGVEDADRADENEVITHEVLEDDVPGEYLDEK